MDVDGAVERSSASGGKTRPRCDNGREHQEASGRHCRISGVPPKYDQPAFFVPRRPDHPSSDLLHTHVASQGVRWRGTTTPALTRRQTTGALKTALCTFFLIVTINNIMAPLPLLYVYRVQPRPQTSHAGSANLYAKVCLRSILVEQRANCSHTYIHRCAWWKRECDILVPIFVASPFTRSPLGPSVG